MLVNHVRQFYPGVVIAGVPNGGNRSKTEGARLKKEGVLAGYPDLLVDEARGGFFGLRIEMKKVGSPGATAKQLSVHRSLRDKGYCVRVCHGYEEAKAAFETYMKNPPTRGSYSVPVERAPLIPEGWTLPLRA
jgi:hypothetical protein